MNVRELQLDSPRTLSDIRLVYPRNWTVILFLASLGALHLTMATLAFSHGQWAGFLSLAFGVIFVAAAIITALVRSDLTVLPAERRVRVRTALRRLGMERSIRFGEIRWVRLMMPPANGSAESATIELVCWYDVVECPPSRIPRQEALCLAMTLGVRLVKVFADDAPDSQRLDTLSPN